MRVEQALEAYLLQLQADGRSPHTRAQVARHVRLFARWSAETGLSGEIEDLGPAQIAGFMACPTARQRPDGREKLPSSVNCLRSSIRAFFAFLHASGYLPTNPARLLRQARCSPPPPKGLTDRDRDRLLSTLEESRGSTADRDRVLVAFLLGTGVRVGSAVALDVGDLDLEAGEILVREAKGGHRTRLHLPGEVRDQLAEFIGGRSSGPLFPARHGGRLTTRHVARLLGGWAKRAGIARKIHPHALRHDFATRLYARTRDVLAVRNALGHRSIGSTLAYARTCD